MPIQPGQIVGDYLVLEPLGAGGTGRVFKVEHLVTKRLEAMKLLLAGEAATSEQVQRFEREIRLQATLRHPNIAPVFNAFFHEGCLFMVMELLDGASLESLISGGMLPPNRVLRIIRQVLSALDHAHCRGVLHRDISTANIMIGVNDEVKLTDFGLAIHREEVRLTVSGTPVGSYYYMSPEQVRGKEALDSRTDLYSCGAVLYELATGQKPFAHADAFSLMEAHTQQDPRRPRDLQPAIPVVLEDAIRRAMAKDRSQRFSSAAEFLAALNAVGATTPVPARGHERPWLALTASLVIVLATVAGALWLARSNPESAPTAAVSAVPDTAVVAPAEAPPVLPLFPAAESALPEAVVRSSAKPVAKPKVATKVRDRAEPSVPSRPRVLLANKETETALPPTAAVKEEPVSPESAATPAPSSHAAVPLPPQGTEPASAEKQEPAARRPSRWGRLRVLNPARIFQRGETSGKAEKPGNADKPVKEVQPSPLRQP